MTTIRQIITDTFREAGLLGAGETPDADQLDEALRRINNLYSSLFGHELGEPLTPVNYGRNDVTNVYGISHDDAAVINTTYIPPNVRLMFNLEEAATLFLDPMPQDGQRFAVIDVSGNLGTFNITVKGNSKKIESASNVVLSTNSLNREWFYRADLGNWARVSDLILDDQSPLPKEFDDFLITLLAIRLHPRYGVQTAEETVEILKRMRKMFRARYRQNLEKDSELALQRLPSNKRYWQWSTFNA